MPQNEGRLIGNRVKLQQRFLQSSAGVHQAFASIPADRTDCVNAAILPANLQIE